MWGWTLNKGECFQLMDEFYQKGCRQVDAATNYPINRITTDFRAAEQILLEWIRAHGISDLQVIMKVGSINNLRTPDHNLSKSFLLLNLDDYRHRFGSNLDTFMIHWDNRVDRAEIGQSLEVLKIAVQEGLQAGLSGIRHPDIYAGLNEEYQLDFRIQAKHNLFQSDLDRYASFKENARFLAYGINAGGVKLCTDRYRPESNLVVRGGAATATPLHTKLETLIPQWNQRALPEPIRNFNQIGMIYAYHHPKINGILIGPSRTEQLQSSLRFFELLAGNAYQPVYQSLLDI